MEKDLRTISFTELTTLRAKAVEEVLWCKNISKVARNLGINRQLLHSWVNRYKINRHFDRWQRGRPRQKLYEAETHKIIHILANKLPSDEELFGHFWTASTVRELVCKIVKRNYSAYFIRRWLSNEVYIWRNYTGLLSEPNSHIEGESVDEYSKNSGMPCYIYWNAEVDGYRFHCIGSKRGDLRFICKGVKDSTDFINKVQYAARKKITVVFKEGRYTSSKPNVSNLSTGVNLILK